MANEVEIHVKWDDKDGDRFVASTKAKAKTAGEKAGDEFGGTLKAKVGPAGEQAGKAAGEGIEKGMKDGARKGGKATDDEMDRVAKRTNKAFDAKLFGGLSLGLPAAAAAGAVGAGAALAAVPALFVGLGAAALKGNAEVEDSFSGLKTHVVNDTQAMAGVLAGPLSESAGQIGASFDRLKPEIQSAMAGSVGAVHELTGTVTDFAENAMPGMVTAVKSSEPTLLGLHSFAEQTGTGLSTFFTNVSQGSTGAGQGLSILGGTVGRLEGNLGTLFANVANGSSGPLRSLDTIVDKVSGGLLDLTSKGSGAMGALQGFSTTGSGAVTVLRGVAAAAAALPPEVTQLAGSVTASGMLLSKFGVDAGAGFEGLGGKVKAAEGFTSKLSTAVTGLAVGALNPATLAVGALGLGLNILGQEQERAAKYAADHEAGIQRLTAAIRADNGVLGEHVRQANIDALTQKNAATNLAAYGETMGDAKLAIEGNSDAYMRLNESSRATMDHIAANIGIVGDQRNEWKDLATQALETGKSYDQFDNNVTAMADTLGGEGGQALRGQIEAIVNANGAVGEQIRQQKAAYDSYIQAEGALNNLSDAQIRNRDATAKATAAIYDQQNAGLGLRGAVLNTKSALDEYAKVSKDGKATEDQKAAALLKVEQAFSAEEEAARKAGQANSSSATDAGKAADGLAAMNRETVNLANSMGNQLPASLSDTIGKMSVAQAQAAGLTVTIDDTGRAVYRLPDGKFIAINSSAQEEAQKVADLQRAIDSIHDRNVKIAVTTFYGTVGQGSSLTGPAIARAKGGLVGYAAGGKVSSIPRFADGGQRMLDVTRGGVMSGPGTGTSDSILALSSAGPFAGSDGEFVVNADQTRKHLPLLEAINDGRDGFAGVSGSAMGGTYASAPSRARAAAVSAQPVQVIVSFETPRDELGRVVVEYMRKYVKINGGGNVQSALGQR